VWGHQRDLEVFHRGAKVFHPKMESDTREQLLAGWRDAIARVRQPSQRVAP
jgi:hypothetical protein